MKDSKRKEIKIQTEVIWETSHSVGASTWNSRMISLGNILCVPCKSPNENVMCKISGKFFFMSPFEMTHAWIESSQCRE